MTESRFEQPTSLPEALSRIEQLEVEAGDIHNQMRFFKAIWEDGHLDESESKNVQTREGYEKWRYKACKAHSWKLAEIRFLKDWILESELTMLLIDLSSEVDDEQLCKRIEECLERLTGSIPEEIAAL